MSELDTASQQPTASINPTTLSVTDEQLKTSTLIGYGLMLAGLVTGGLLSIAGVIWAYIKKDEAAGTIYADHYKNIIVTFWWSLGLGILGFILTFVFIGIFVLLGVWIWSIYRLVKGLVRVTSQQAYYS